MSRALFPKETTIVQLIYMLFDDPFNTRGIDVHTLSYSKPVANANQTSISFFRKFNSTTHPFEYAISTIKLQSYTATCHLRIRKKDCFAWTVI